MYSKKFKVALGALAVMVLIPIGAYAASQESQYSFTTINLTVDQSVIQKVEDFLRQTYGNELTVWTENPVDSAPRKVFKYPSESDSSEQGKDVLEHIRRIMRGEDTTDGWGWVCHSLHAWYFYTGPYLNACGNQGDEVNYSDLSSYGMNDRASSFFEDNVSGAVDVYDNTGYYGFLDTLWSDTGVFGNYLNDKASSAKFFL
jgi:hypothetical protein